ncbi:diacylglycerol kinase family lipid kinase [Actinocorallia lasiicapitis]
MADWSRAVIIANPGAGGSPAGLVPEVERACRAVRPGPKQVEVRWTRGPGDAELLARQTAEPGERTLVPAVGGDGTLAEAAAGLADRDDAALAAIPAGTANSLYRTWWEDAPWQESLAACLDGSAELRHLDYARWRRNGRLILAGAATGFPPQGIHEAATYTNLSGTARYEMGMARLIPRFEPYPGRVTVDGEEVHRGDTLLVNIGGSRYRGGSFAVLPHTILDDGLLDVVVVGAENRLAEVLRLARTGEHVDLPGAVYARGRSITVERTDGQPVWFEHDGEVLPDTSGPLTFDVAEVHLPALVGPAAAERLLPR